ncbi:GNAT family N-acetyltransferase, partial [Actinomadura sp. BRA 177]|uniref:GNAT family N-acetyltransferase n=1 Tax=Actinomadura sp. BRA 177 TaxID=2745202 RepID=UPI001595D03F
ANTVSLTVAEAIRVQGPELYGFVLFGWWTSGGGIEGTFLWTGTHPPLLNAMPERAARELADVLAARGPAIAGVNGTPVTAAAFAEAWRRRTGAPSRIGMRQRLHRLARLEPPDPAPDGAARVAGGADLDLVLEWSAQFHRDAGGGAPNAAVTRGRLAEGGITLWEAGGRPVAMAGRTPAVAGVARIAPVYTPAEYRRRGYGAAVTAAATQGALDAGAGGVVLFTDLANPTSNGVYRRIGYRPVEDRVVLAFG